MHIVSLDWIEQFKTTNGGWTGIQLTAIGEGWPPKAEWKERANGRVISDREKQVFESGDTNGVKARKAVTQFQKAKANRYAGSLSFKFGFGCQVKTSKIYRECIKRDRGLLGLDKYSAVLAYWDKYHAGEEPPARPGKRKRGKREVRASRPVYAPKSKASPADEFYASWEWHKARYETLKKYGAVCLCCGSTERIVVDHIRPRRLFPELELDLSNLQPLCDSCNKGKSWDDQTDWRPKEDALSPEEQAHMNALRLN